MKIFTQPLKYKLHNLTNCALLSAFLLISCFIGTGLQAQITCGPINTLYQTIGNTGNNTTEIYRYNNFQQSYILVGNLPGVTRNSASNSAYNATTQYVYSSTGGSTVRVYDPAANYSFVGEITITGNSQNFNNVLFAQGDFVGFVNNNTVVRFNVTGIAAYPAVVTVEPELTIPGAGGANDYSLIGNEIYGVTGSTLQVIDLTGAGSLTNRALTIDNSLDGVPNGGGYGAAWQDRNGNFYTFNNANGGIYKITDVINPTSTNLVKVLIAAPSNLNDGFGCEIGPDPLDWDDDLVENNTDIDDDNDGILDVDESGGTGIDPGGDIDGDAIFNYRDADIPGYVDTNGDTINDVFDFDLDGVPDAYDLDSDNDGIPDNIEAQTTNGYVAPGMDTDGNGLSDVYETAPGNGEGITVINTDGADNPDILDFDSDNDGIYDTNEAGITLTGMDSDLDGLDNATDATTDVTDPNGTIDDPTLLPDADGDVGSGGDVDYRDSSDLDGDGVLDATDLDDDNDGILDTVEYPAFDPFGDEDGDGIYNFADAVDNGTGDGSATDYTDTNVDGYPDAFDADLDAVPNHLDLDSDGDNCSDANEAYSDSNADGGDGGAYGIGNPPPTEPDGTVSAATYPGTNADVTTNGPDNEGDGVADVCDLDDDNDGNPDTTDANAQVAVATNDAASATGGVAEVIQILVNDDFTDNTDGNGDPDNFDPISNTTIMTVTGPNTTAMGTIAYDPATGELTYTPTFGEGGTTVTIEYRVCNDVNGDSPGITTDDVCDNAIVTIMVAFGDSDGDGVLDNVDQCPGFDDNADIDGDGVADGCDADDDNDGINDTDEANGLPNPSGDADMDGVPTYLDDDDSDAGTGDTDGIEVGYDADGDTIPNHLDLDSDNDGIYDVAESGGADANNDGIADGLIDANGIPSSASPAGNTPVSSDADGNPDFLDTDSDDDGCSDANEYYNNDTADGGDAGHYGNDPAAVFPNGTVIAAPYTATAADTDTNSISDYTEGTALAPLPDPDGDLMANACDPDDDGDGNPDTQDPNTQTPSTQPDADTATAGLPQTTQILGNDDYLPQGDVNNLGTTTIANAGTGTGMGTVTFDPATGEIIYTPLFSEGGMSVTIDYTVCNDASGAPICMTETVTFAVAFGDSDGDGIPDNLDQCPGFDDNADADSDGIADGCDADDDNDGINDSTESGGNDPDGDEDGDGILNYLDTTDNDPGNTMGDGSMTVYTDLDGNTIPDVYDFDGDGIANHQDLDSDNDGIYDVAESGGTDNNGDGFADGIDFDGNGIPDTAGTGTIPTDSGPTPGTPDFVDLDSDEDGCSDANEYFNDTNADGGDGGSFGTGEPQLAVNANGTVVGATYGTQGLASDTNGNTVADYQENGPEADTDGIANACDFDDDGDGNPDANEIANSTDPLAPNVMDDTGMTSVGTAVTVNVLSNDDYLANNDPNVLGNTTLTNTGGGTALGTVMVDPLTGEITYTPDATENGPVTIIYEVCSEDGNPIPPGNIVCNQATLTINVSGLDSDMDGVVDSVDLDDDNDGVLDSEETPGLLDPSADADMDGVPNYMDTDIGADANGDGVVDAYDFDGDGVANHLDLDSDNDGIYDVDETGGTDTNNDGIADGAINPATGIPATGGQGVIDSDGGGATEADFLDTDSDNDGCSDANEAYNDPTADGGDDEQYGTGPLSTTLGNVNPDGTVVAADYSIGTNGDVTTFGPDPDGDLIANACDLDDDGDGNPDANEIANSTDPLAPNVMDDTAMTSVGTPVTVNVLSNDDYLANNDPNVLGNTTLTNTGGGTALGTVMVDPLTGEITYTPDATENGPVTIIYEVCSEDGNPIPPGNIVCNQATLTINVSGLDSDMDGVVDSVDLDDDNDGVLDSEETPGLLDPSADADMDGVPNYMDTDIGADANGDGVVDAYDFDGDGVANHLDLDSDNDGIYDVDETGGTDTNNDGIADGAINPATGIPATGGQGVIDSDGGGATEADFLDTDSDNDGCSDANEAYNDPTADGGDDEQYGTGPLSTTLGNVNQDGTVVAADYSIGTNGDVTTFGPDPDGDLIANACDLDDDGDGNPDANEIANSTDPLAPNVMDDTGMTSVGTAVTVNVLSNDDYLANNDPNVLGNTTLTNTGGGTALGTVMVDPLTGEITYTPDATENGPVTIIYEVCSEDGNPIPPGNIVCNQATLTINVSGLDSDMDGVVDSVDLDDDNDGVLDSEETPGLLDPSADADMDGVPNYMDTDIGADANGDGVVDAYDFDGDGVANHLDLDSDNDGIYDVDETGGTDTNNDGIADGAINPATGIPATGGQGVIDSDGGGATEADFLDTDSDNDGCSDANEAYNDPTADGGDDEQYGTGPLSTTLGNVNPDGTVVAADYSIGTNGDVTTFGPDPDGDLIANACDLDDDGDGNPDANEIANSTDPLAPNVMDDTGMTSVGTAVTVNVLSNDDYLANNDPNVLGNTTLTNTGGGTALGTVMVDPLTGEITYTPDATENGPVTIIYEVCSEDGNPIPPGNIVCNQATLTINVSGLDSDMDGVVDSVDLDDDNDGVLDSEETPGLLDPSADADMDGVPNYMDTDIGADANGDGVVDAYDFDGDGVANHLDLDSDNDGIYDVDETGGTDNNNDGIADGAINPATGIPATGGQGVIDSDGGGATEADFLDTDSDNDGCSDANEAYNDPTADGGDDEQYGTGPLSTTLGNVNQDGTVVAADYSIGTNGDVTTFGPDPDGDLIANACDLDDDGDGNPDANEIANSTDPLAPNVMDDTGMTSVGTAVTVNVLSNDDYLANNDPNVLGNTTLTNTGGGTALGTVMVDPLTGEITYTPDATENGPVTIIYEVCSEDGNPIPPGNIVCNQATLTINVSGLDSDMDGVVDSVDLDDDNDGVLDSEETPGLLDPSADADMDGVPNYMDTDIGADANGDGVVDAYDFDGDGVANHLDLDSDNDGIYDVDETGGTDNNNDGIADGAINPATGIPATGGQGVIDSDGGGATEADFLDTDSDNDGCSDANEAYNDPTADGGDDEQYGTGPLSTTLGNVNPDGTVVAAPYTNPVDNDGDLTDDYQQVGGPDADADGIPDGCDSIFNDADMDGIPDAVDVDDDNDGISDIVESNGNEPNGDADGDTIPNYLDTFDDAGAGDGSMTAYTDNNGDGVPDVYDFDSDGIPNHLDLDGDNDGILDIVESGNGALDTDGDGDVDSNDAVFSDTNNDGQDDNAAFNVPTDSDGGNGNPDFVDIDADDDGIPDNVEAQSTFSYIGLTPVFVDSNMNGVNDSYEGGLTVENTDGDFTPDYQDSDSDNDGINDVLEAGQGAFLGVDADGDGLDDGFDNDISVLGAPFDVNDNLDSGADGTDNNDNPSTAEVDFRETTDNDGDGVPDPLDLDDDNDGIADIDENLNGQDPSGDDNGDGIPNFMDPITGGGDANGDGIADDFDADGDGVPNHFDLDADNDGIYDVIETNGTDANNDGLADDTDGDSTNNNGIPSTAGTGNAPIDSGTDPTTPDFLDTDSDEDGCSDANEAYNDPNADAGDGPQYGAGDPLVLGAGVNPDGTVTAAPYIDPNVATNNFPADTDSNSVADYMELGPEADADGIANACDLDDDGDGNPDTNEIANGSNPLSPDTMDDVATTNVGTPVTIDILANDDYLPQNDPNVLGITTITDTGAGTAMGMILFNATTGEVTYTPDAAENGDVTIVYEVCSDDGVNAPICMTAIITITITGTDNDGDGVFDFADLDDDNDGILDTDETPLGFPNPSDDDDSDGIPNYADTDLGLDANGDGVVDAYDYDGDGVPNHFDLDADNDGIYDLIETNGTDANNDGLADDTDGDTTNNNGVPNSANGGTGNTPIDNGTDPTTPDFLDTDSDEDGCSDANEAYNDPNADGGDGGQYGIGDPLTLAGGDVAPNGTVVLAPYIDPNVVTNNFPADTDSNSVADYMELGPEADADGIANACDLDDDGDGNPDTNEIANGSNPLSPDTMDDVATTNVGTPVTIDILANDDYLPQNDPNVLGITTITDTGAGTAMGMIVFNATTGELTYTPDAAENGDVTIVYEVCSDDGVNAPICMTAIVTITITGTDNDGDGVFDFADLDDDNDGILDTDETPLGFPNPSDDDDSDGIPNYADTDLGLDANGDGVVDAYDTDGDGVPNHFDLDADNDGIYDVIETNGADANNDGLADDTDGDSTNNNGIPSTAGTGNAPIDSGTDPTTPDFLDTDSDEDGCSDANEAYNDPNADAGDGPQYGAGDPLVLGAGVNPDGTVTAAPYIDPNVATNNFPADTDSNSVADYIELGPEADADGIANACDLDDDGDGNPDTNEIANGSNPLSPDTMDDVATTNVGTPVTIDILANDDYLPQNNPNVLGITTITDTGAGTAMGMIVFNATTGELTYTPDAAENGDVTIVYEVCSDDGVNAPICMTAIVTITITGTDNDGDGVVDALDLDDDNDGILDSDETAGLLDPSDDDDSDGIPNYADTDLGVDANGDGIVDVYDFDGDGVPNHFDLDADNDGIYDVDETGGIDANNDGFADDNDGDPTNNNGVPNSANGGTGNPPIDSGATVGTPDFLDLDSDEDGCSDANEAYNDPNADGGDGGQYGIGDPLTLAGGDVTPSGSVIGAPYTTGAVSDVIIPGPDIDNDGIAAVCDPDDDGDGNPDDTDPNPLTPVAIDDTAATDVGVAVVVSVLDNDDYLDNNDPTNLGITTVSDTGAGTAVGIIVIDPITGEISYTPAATEAGLTVTIVYEVCNDESGAPICTQATVFIQVSGPDNDMDGVPDATDLDDDNDGILDTDESPGLANPSGDDDLDGIPNFADPDLPGSTDVNGDGINDEYDQDGDGVPNHFDLDADNDGIYDVDETAGTDTNNDGLADDTDGDPTNNNGVPNTANGGTGNIPINSDGDADADFLDLDSDDDGCSDANEAYNDPNADAGDGGQYGFGDPLTLGEGEIDENGVVIAASYTTGAVADVTTAGPDIDNDGIAAVCDPDDDGDGNPDETDPNPTTPVAVDDNAQTQAGIAVVVSVLDNDDYLDNNDPTNLGTTTVADAGLGTAQGIVVIDPITGAITYTPTSEENGFTVTIVYEVCNDESGTPICTQATVFIVVGGPDTDMDGVPDSIDLDDDNDGILDIDEAMGLPVPSDDDDMDGIPNFADTDNGVDANGDGIVDAYDQDGDGVPNHLDLDADNDGIYDVDEVGGIDANNDGFADDTDGNSTNNMGVPNSANSGLGTIPFDTDGDGSLDFLDLDSDNDGCSDANEAYGVPDADGGDGGMYGIGDPLTLFEGEVDDFGRVETAPYNTGQVEAVVEAGPDPDEDGISNSCDLDDDGDGVSDIQEIMDGTDPLDPCDYVETNQDPNNTAASYDALDCDGDGVINGTELVDGTSPLDPCDFIVTSITRPPSGAFLLADCDGDGVTNGDELADGTEPLDFCDFITASMTVTPSDAFLAFDCDGDGVSNGQELLDETEPLDPCDYDFNSQVIDYENQIVVGVSDAWLDLDCDGDGLLNGIEIADNNDNGIPDYDEVNNGDANSDDNLDVFDIVTPNGDGLNDVFVIRGIEQYPNNTLEIYNRWGVKVYDAEGYGQGDVFFRGYSDGRATVDRNERLPVGTYYYILNYVNDNGDNKRLAGPLYINRR